MKHYEESKEPCLGLGDYTNPSTAFFKTLASKATTGFALRQYLRTLCGTRE